MPFEFLVAPYTEQNELYCEDHIIGLKDSLVTLVWTSFTGTTRTAKFFFSPRHQDTQSRSGIGPSSQRRWPRPIRSVSVQRPFGKARGSPIAGIDGVGTSEPSKAKLLRNPLRTSSPHTRDSTPPWIVDERRATLHLTVHRSAVKEAATDTKDAVEDSETAGSESALRLPDLDQAKSTVLNTLSSIDAQRGYGTPLRIHRMILLGAAVILQQDRRPPVSHTWNAATGARHNQSSPRSQRRLAVFFPNKPAIDACAE